MFSVHTKILKTGFERGELKANAQLKPFSVTFLHKHTWKIVKFKFLTVKVYNEIVNRRHISWIFNKFNLKVSNHWSGNLSFVNSTVTMADVYWLSNFSKAAHSEAKRSSFKFGQFDKLLHSISQTKALKKRKQKP